MISNAIIAPIQLNALKVIDVHLKLTGEEADNMKLNLGIEYKTSELDGNESDGVYALRASLALAASLADPENESDIRLDSGASILIEVSIDASYFKAPEEARDYLAKNARFDGVCTRKIRAHDHRRDDPSGRLHPPADYPKRHQAARAMTEATRQLSGRQQYLPINRISRPMPQTVIHSLNP